MSSANPETEKSRDIDLRIALVQRLLSDGIPRQAIRHEVPLDSYSGAGRADVVVAMPDWIMGIEIKSGSDTLDRLDGQSIGYGHCFDRLVLLHDAKHREPLRERVGWRKIEPADLALDAGLMMPWHASCAAWRNGSHHHRRSPEATLSLLWAREAVDVVRRLGGACRTRAGAVKWARENASLAMIRGPICAALRSRQPSKWDESFWRRYDDADHAESEERP